MRVGMNFHKTRKQQGIIIVESRIIVITSAARKYGNLNIRSCGKDFFPKDCFGSNSRRTGMGKPITIEAPGIKNPGIIS